MKSCKKECKSENSKVELENGKTRKLHCLNHCDGCDYEGGFCPIECFTECNDCLCCACEHIPDEYEEEKSMACIYSVIYNDALMTECAASEPWRFP